MSETIDNRVVQLDLENASFENNARKSIDTLNDLDKALEFKNGKRGFDEVERAAEKTNFATLIQAADTVTNRLSALEVVGVTALQKITNKAIDAGEKLVRSLSLDQITAGYSKYEQKTAAVQTLVNATGKSVDRINDYLEDLMWFSDETSYGFTDMTRALSTMVTSGGDIEKLIPMIMGVANATAFAGKGAAEFSRVMYNLNQSYSAGALAYVDWRSVELAGASSKELKQLLIDVGVAQGKIKEGQVDIASFASTLRDKWVDTEVMQEAFGKMAEVTMKARQMVNDGIVDTASEAYEILGAEYDGVTMRAALAAQQAKTLTEAIDSVKDAVSTGWMTTFETIFGDYAQASKLWTSVANDLWDIFASGAETRNAELSEVLSSGFAKVQAAAGEAGISVDEFQNAIMDVAEGKGMDLGSLITEYGTLDAALRSTETGARIVREALANIAEGAGDGENKLVIALRNTNSELNQALTDFNKRSGTEVIGSALHNVFQTIVDIKSLTGEAWGKVFGDIDTGGIFAMMESIEDATTSISIFVHENEQLRSGLEQVFGLTKAAADMGKAVFGVVGSMGNLVGRFIDYTVKLPPVAEALTTIKSTIAGLIGGGTDGLSGFAGKLDTIAKSLDNIGPEQFAEVYKYADRFAATLRNIGRQFQTVYQKTQPFRTEVGGLLKDAGAKLSDEDPLSALTRGLENVWEWVTKIGKIGKDLLTRIFGTNDVGKSVTEQLNPILTTLGNIATKAREAAKSLDFGKLLAAGIAAGVLFVLLRIASSIGQIGGLANTVKKTFDNINTLLRTKFGSGFAKNMRNVAVSIAIMAGSVALLAMLPVRDMWSAVGAISVLSLVMAGLSYGLRWMASKVTVQDAKGLAALSKALLSFAVTIAIISFASKQLVSAYANISESGNPMSVAGSVALTLVAIAGIIGLYTIVIAAAAKLSGGKGTGVILSAIVGMIVGIKMFTVMLDAIDRFGSDKVWSAMLPVLALAGVVAGIAVVVGVMLALMQKTSVSLGTVLYFAAGVGILVAAVWGIVQALKPLADMDAGKLLANVKTLGWVAAGLVVFGAVMVGLAVAAEKIPTIGVAFVIAAAAIVILTAALWVMADAVAKVGSVDLEGLADGLTRLGKATGWAALGGVGLFVAAAGLGVFGMVASGAAGGIYALTGALEAMLSLLGAVGNAWAKGGGTFSGWLTNIGSELRGSASEIQNTAQSIGEGLDTTAAAIDKKSDVISGATGSAITEAVDAVTAAAPEVEAAAVQTVEETGDAAAEAIEQQGGKLQSAAASVLGMLFGAGDGMDGMDPSKYTAVMQNAMGSAFDGVDPSKYTAVMQNAMGSAFGGVDLSKYTAVMQNAMGSAFDGVDLSASGEALGQQIADGAASYLTNAERLGDIEDAGRSMAEAAITGAESVDASASGEFFGEGFVQGILSSVASATYAAGVLGHEALEALKEAIRQGSPSKLTILSGEFFGKGFVLGIDAMVRQAGNTAWKLGQKAVQYLNEGIADAGDGISPVLDMSEVYHSMEEFDGVWRPVIRPMLDMSGANPGLLNARAVVTGQMEGYRLDGLRANSPQTAAAPTSVSFTQNNYSPKALSRTEIYRNTKNQITMLQGALNRR